MYPFHFKPNESQSNGPVEGVNFFKELSKTIRKKFRAACDIINRAAC